LTGPARALFWLQGLLLLQISCQLALLVPALGAFRIVWRCASFGASVALLILVRGEGPPHPCQRWAPVVLALVALGFLHPTTNTPMAAAAQWGLYFAVLAPLFWVPRLMVTPAILRRIVFLIWVFQSLSAGVGVLQMLYPGQFQPNLSSNITGHTKDALTITLANGEKVLRPMGLTDMPGGAAAASLYAVLFGIRYFVKGQTLLLRLAAVGSIGVGLFCIYLSQVRSILVMTGVCAACLIGLLALRGEWSRLTSLIAVLVVVVIGSFLWAVSVGGKSVTDRVSTLAEDRAENVYYTNRGIFVEYTINELMPQYPTGAGLGRWGMTHQYFGNDRDPQSQPIHVEIQLTAWLLDGGIPLIVAYAGMLLLACATAWRIARSRLPGDLPLEAAVILAYNIGAVAVTFNYPLFISQGGLEFWLLNAILFAACVTVARRWPLVRPVPA
jgi:hypothetical protein